MILIEEVKRCHLLSLALRASFVVITTH